MVKDTLSVIIPTYNRNLIVLKTLGDFNGQTIKNFELIVLDQTQNPENDLVNFKSKKYNYSYFNIDEIGLPNARNVAAEKANGEILVFVDDDVIPEGNLVEQYLLEFKNNPEPNIVIGGKVIEPGSNIMNNNLKITGGQITFYGKTMKNFSSNEYENCQWVVGCNFAVRRDYLLEIGGFDKNYQGNAMLEDCDFCFTVKKYGGRILFSPKPMLEHLRASTGGTRQKNASKGMLYRSHNTVYFFRKHGLSHLLPFVIVYLNAVALKDFILRKHGVSAFILTWNGIYKGFITKINQ